MNWTDYAAFLVTLCVAVLGIIGTKIALHGRTDQAATRGWRVSLALNVIFLLVGVVALVATRLDRAKQAEMEQERNAQMQKIEQQRIAQMQKTEQERNDQIRELSEDVRRFVAFNSLPSVPNESMKLRISPDYALAPSNSLPLKKRARLLSAEMLQFVEDRTPRGYAPGVAGNFSGFEKALKVWLKTSVKEYEAFMIEYSTKFSKRVIAVHDELVAEGIQTAVVNELYRDPKNPNGVRLLAEQIGILAERAP